MKEELTQQVSEVPCPLDKNGCYALACYSGQKCNVRDENGNPMYASLEQIKKYDKEKKKLK